MDRKTHLQGNVCRANGGVCIRKSFAGGLDYGQGLENVFDGCEFSACEDKRGVIGVLAKVVKMFLQEKEIPQHPRDGVPSRFDIEDQSDGDSLLDGNLFKLVIKSGAFLDAAARFPDSVDEVARCAGVLGLSELTLLDEFFIEDFLIFYQRKKISDQRST